MPRIVDRPDRLIGEVRDPDVGQRFGRPWSVLRQQLLGELDTNIGQGPHDAVERWKRPIAVDPDGDVGVSTTDIGQVVGGSGGDLDLEPRDTSACELVDAVRGIIDADGDTHRDRGGSGCPE